MEKEKKIFDAMQEDIENANIPDSEKAKLMKNLLHLKEQKINLMITGATGCGKSSTINALFDMEVAKVGVGVDPETMEITKYELDNLILWDSPGLGDGKEADNRHAKNIIKKLNELDENNNLLIDLVLVILDGSTRDLGTSYELINNVIIPNLGENKKDRILVAINQADAAMKGRHWDYNTNKPDGELEKFLEENAFWLEDYCMYMAIKDAHEGKSWSEWEELLKKREKTALEKVKEELEDEIGFYQFQQYEFDRQWKKLHTYAKEQGIQIIGDIPIYVAFDSADVWAAPELFQFDEENNPIRVAGCPPDAFAKTGQLWGNPLYNWEYHQKTGYAWWIQRIRYCFQLYDVVRIDHFRGFDEYYAIPYGEPTAENGTWMPGPGMKLFQAIEKELGRPEIIAEDLGFLTESVLQMLKESGFPGMKVLQFAFDPSGESVYLPHRYSENCVVYTGTHDNDTTRGWYRTLDKESRDFAKEYMGVSRLDDDTLTWDFMRLAMGSAAQLCMTPIQDILGIDGSGRINMPSTLGGNWTWQMEKGAFDKKIVHKLYRMTQLYGRLNEQIKKQPEPGMENLKCKEKKNRKE